MVYSKYMKKFWIDFVIVGIITACAVYYVFRQESTEKITQFSHSPLTAVSSGISSESGNIIVIKPRPNEAIDIPLSITGKARVFENVLQYRVKDSKGNIISIGKTTAKSKDVS